MVLVLSLPCYAPRVNLRVFAPQFLTCKVGAILTLPSLESILRDRGCPILTLFVHSRRGIWALSPKQPKNEEQMVGGGDSQIPDAGTYLLPTNLTLVKLSMHLFFLRLHFGCAKISGVPFCYRLSGFFTNSLFLHHPASETP